MIYTVSEIADAVKPLARSYGVQKIYLFGSYARGEATEKSDIDILVDNAQPIGLFRLSSFMNALTKTLKKNIGIVTVNALNDGDERFANNVKQEEILIYAEGD